MCPKGNPGQGETPVTRPSKRGFKTQVFWHPRRGRFPATSGRLGSSWGTCKSQVASAVSWPPQKKTWVWVWWREGWRTLFLAPRTYTMDIVDISDIDMFVWFGWFSRCIIQYIFLKILFYSSCDDDNMVAETDVRCFTADTTNLVHIYAIYYTNFVPCESIYCDEDMLSTRDTTPVSKGTLGRADQKPIHGSCAIYFLGSLTFLMIEMMDIHGYSQIFSQLVLFRKRRKVKWMIWD